MAVWAATLAAAPWFGLPIIWENTAFSIFNETLDVSMLITAAEGFAPANCSDAVRGCGATIVSDAREHALADIIAILDSRY